MSGSYFGPLALGLGDVSPEEERRTADLAERVLAAEERMNMAIGKDKDEATIDVLVADKGYYKTEELAALP